VGTQTLSASLDGYSATFTADAQAGSPASVEAMTTYPGTFDPATALPQDVVFEVEDEYSNKVPGVTVTFSASDGGSADPSSATTDSQGQVSTTWTLGPDNGVQTLTATAGGSATGTATAEAYHPCLDFRPITLDVQVQGEITLASCEMVIENQLRFLDQYALTLQADAAVYVVANTEFAGTNVQLWDADPEDPSGKVTWFGTTYGHNINFYAFLDGGASTVGGQGSLSAGKTYTFRVASREARTGTYDFEIQQVDGQMDIGRRFVTTGRLDTNQTLSSADDTRPAGPYADNLLIHLNEGERVLLEQRSNDFEPCLYIRGQGSRWDGEVSLDQTVSTLDFTAPAYGYYNIWVSSAETGQTGAYNLKITPVTTTTPGGSSR
jgi:hypothetical protein